MDIQCRCSACQSLFKVGMAAAGKKARCPKCQAVVEVPRAPADETVRIPAPTLKRAKALEIPPQIPPVAVPSQSSSDTWSTGNSPTVSGSLPPAKSPSLAPPPVNTPKDEEIAVSPDSSNDNAPLPFSIDPPKPTSFVTTSSSPTSAAAKPAKKKSSPLPYVIGGALMVLLIAGGAIGGFIMFANGSNSPAKGGKGTPLASGKGTLILNWPEEARKSSAVLIDDKRQNLPSKGEAKFSLSAGKHKIFLQRRGFEPVETTVTLAPNQTEHLSPTWKEASTGIVSTPGTPADPTKTPGTGSSGFPIGGGTGPSVAPQGFAGWLQLLEVAQRQAVQQKKDILIVFGVSDGSPETQVIAKALNNGPGKAAVNASFIPVVIDFPQTREGFNLVDDRSQNDMLRRQYGVSQVPVLVLTDEKGLPYFVERDWKGGHAGVLSQLESWKANKATRNGLLATASMGDDKARTNAAVAALSWLSERRLIPLYEKDVRQWQSLVQRVDPSNTQGHLEKFVEADLQIRLRDVDIDDAQDVVRALEPLAAWMGPRRFVDQNRGASLHLLAAGLLFKLERREEGLKHLEQAITYKPMDKELEEALAGAKSALVNRNILSNGTGFVVSAAGYMLTNHHVIEGEGRVVVRLPGVKNPVPASVVAQDERLDMALIKLDLPPGVKLTAIPISNVELGRGAPVGAFGYPLASTVGSGLKLTIGVVSALPDSSENNMLLLDLRVNPGNSGGPLCDSKGNVIGMVTAKTRTESSESVDSYGMARPAADLIKFLDTHLPKEAKRAEALPTGEPLPWDQVDRRVNPSVHMILKVL